MATIFTNDVGTLPSAGAIIRPRPSVRPAVAPPWFKDAIIYQLHVRAFYDSNGDGVGDFRGLAQKLDYIQDLGVTAIWMLPFFPSPLRDDGYDIADYRDVNPQYGTLYDFQVLLEEAHRRDLRIVTELVMNHTSDQHAWFQRSRRAAPGDPWRDWYVWSHTPDKYQEARIIFQDFEVSNWTWDPVAQAYFWHRFYHHQPDLNFDNPQVHQEMIDTVDFWLDLGVDGLRLDAIPYLYEREGTNCENLPETHQFLKDLRKHVDSKYADKMLLAEANQWPEDAAEYFGDGDECHMNFHFPLMPRLFMAVEREDRFPIVDILDQTPILPQTCQWAIFLRNHDELTLEMVTDEERDYMYRVYALDTQARINLGIRRRLAPLMKNDRRKFELMNALLLSLPGTPIIYYGDEIGMGDNYYLGDRNGVRTPMQWSSDRNAGFSSGNPQRLYLPVIIDPEYHYELRNVEVEQSSPHSLLWWMRRILDLRKQYPAFGNGSFEALSANNSKIFAFVRETDEQTILVAANLSRFAQYAELDLSKYRGRTPMELFGQVMFPTIGDEPYMLAFAPHGFYWFCIGCREPAATDSATVELPTIQSRDGWENLLKGRSRIALREALEPYLRRHRWFQSKARTIQSTDIVDVFELDSSYMDAPIRMLIISVTYTEGEPDAYIVPVVLVNEQVADEILELHPTAGIIRVESPEGDPTLLLCEATWSQELWAELLYFVNDRKTLSGQHGVLAGLRTSAFLRIADEGIVDDVPSIHGGEQSNTSARFDGQFIMKLFRRVSPGLNPDFEIGRQLTEVRPLEHVPDVAGAVEYRTPAGQPMTVAILHEFVESVGDGWTYTLEELGRYFERVTAHSGNPGMAANTAAAPSVTGAAPSPAVTQAGPNGSVTAVEPAADSVVSAAFDLLSSRSLVDLTRLDPPPLAHETIGAYLHTAQLLGERTADLHVALSEIPDPPAFAAEPFTRLYQRSLYQSMRSQARGTMDLLRRQRPRLEGLIAELADQVLQRESTVLSRFSRLLQMRIDARRIRCHGDFHLGQTLFTGKDWVIIDFEGEPERPVSERRIKASPLRDVAGMIRSLHYVANAAILGQTPTILIAHSAKYSAEQWATFWYAWTAAAFLGAYCNRATPAGFLPPDDAQLRTLLEAYLMEKSLYELRYELNNRPDWVRIPLEGILQLLE
jgi:maltose alpha-D-glucosyltransferase / alpha-amylase